MANGHGGPRTPSNPAAVSGPGALSQRTDGRPKVMPLADAQYGEQQAFHDQQTAAPMVSQSPGQGGGQGVDLSAVTPLGAPSQQPGTPVTDGAAVGPGSGAGAVGVYGNPTKADAQWLAQYVPVLIDVAQRSTTTPETKRFIRTVLANM